MPKPASKAPSKRWLYGPIFLVALLFAAYSAYWFYAKGQIETGIDGWIASERAAGKTVDFTAKTVRGYPYRFALHVEDPNYADPAGGFDWRGQKLEIVMQPWNFSHAIIRSSGRNEFTQGAAAPIIAILGPKSALSLKWNSETITQAGLSIDEADIVLADGDIAVAGLDMSYIGLLPSAALGSRLAVDLKTLRLGPDFPLPDNLDVFGREITDSRLRLEGQGFGIFGAAETRKAELAQFLFNAGPLKLGAKGTFDINDEGYPDGILNIRLEEPDDLKTSLSAAGLLNFEANVMLEAVAAGSANGKFFPLPLRNGSVSILGQSIAPVPRVAPPL